MHEAGTGAPTREVIAWREPAFTDVAALDAEMRRVADICHLCRRCFNLCDSFPRLFDAIDNSRTGELDSVSSADFKPVVDACTLCDMCFMTKCPYVPPHEFNLDFPHLMLRYRTAELAQGKVGFVDRQLRKTERNGTWGVRLSALANWATRTTNTLTRGLLETFAGIHRKAGLPLYARRTLVAQANALPPVAHAAPRRKAVIYATCFGNYNKPSIGIATRAVLAKAGVAVEVVHPGCCGMPLLETGDLAAVAESAKTISAALAPWVDRGYDVLALTPSCALMLKFEWPLIAPNDPNVRKLSTATRDIAEYVVEVAKKDGLPGELQPLDAPVALHLSCHSRAQNMGPKAAELLRLIPGAEVTVVERCSEHGGAWGITKENFPVALKLGRPVAQAAIDSGARHVSSECPLAADHIVQGMEELGAKPSPAQHPIELFARSYGVSP